MTPFERGEKVRLRIGVTKPLVVDAVVILDLGEETVIVARRAKANTTRRVKRTRVIPVPVKAPVEPVPTVPTSETPLVDPHLVHSAETAKGICALQRQRNPPTRNEMAEGVFTLCGEWVTSRSKPNMMEPSCPGCRRLLGI